MKHLQDQLDESEQEIQDRMLLEKADTTLDRLKLEVT
jgi:hypothetical protein